MSSKLHKSNPCIFSYLKAHFKPTANSGLSLNVAKLATQGLHRKASNMHLYLTSLAVLGTKSTSIHKPTHLDTSLNISIDLPVNMEPEAKRHKKE